MSALSVTPHEVVEVPDLTTYEIITTEGAVWQEAFPKAIDAFCFAVDALKGDDVAEVICNITIADDTVTGIVTVWRDHIKHQHHVRVRPHRLNAKVRAAA